MAVEDVSSSTARSIGELAEEAAVRKYDNLEQSNAPFYDLRNTENGYLYSVKAARTYRSNGTSSGRFRLWQNAHRKFMDERGSYIFVVYSVTDDGDPEIWKIEKVGQQKVDDAVRGNWYASGHSDPQKDYQYKLPWRDILSS